MKYHLSTRSIDALTGLNFRQRLAVLETAAKRLDGIERMVLNLIKLVAIIGGFVCLYQMAEDWRAVFGVIIAILCYPLALRPVYYYLCSKHIKAADIQQVKDAGTESS